MMKPWLSFPLLSASRVAKMDRFVVPNIVDTLLPEDPMGNSLANSEV
jgi:hypothetical protein